MTGMDDPTRPDGLNLAADPQPPLPPRPAPWNLPVAWNIPDVAPDDPGDAVRPLAALVSFHYLRAAVRRRWLRCLLLALVGLLLASAFLAASPALPTATTTLLLTHDANVEPQGAMATDVSLLSTRGVAERAIEDLGLSMTPKQLLDSVTPVETGSTEILQLTMTGPTTSEAIRRLDTFSREYLRFRADQVTARSKILIAGYQQQIEQLTAQLQDANKKIATLPPTGDTTTDVVAEASKLSDQITTIQGEQQEAQLQQSAIVNASRVIDPAGPTSSGGLRRVATALVTGLIGGAALALCVVILQAILSDRLWLRVEVSSALSTSVLISVRRIAPLSSLLGMGRFLPAVRAMETRRRADRQRMALAVEHCLPAPGKRQSLAVVCLRNSDEMRYGVAAAAMSLREHGRTATIIDLTESGEVTAAAARLAGGSTDRHPEVFRPDVVPSLTRGPADLDASDWDEVALAKARNGVTLVLADLDPAVGVDYLATWTDNVLVAVTAGRSSVELVRTTGDLIRTAGLHLQGAVLLGVARDDVSSGRAAPAHRDDGGSAGTGTRPDKGAGRSLLP